MFATIYFYIHQLLVNKCLFLYVLSNYKRLGYHNSEMNHTVIAKATDKTIIHLGEKRHYDLTGSANKIVNSLNVTNNVH